MVRRILVIIPIAVFLCFSILPIKNVGNGESLAIAEGEYFIGELLSSYTTDFSFSSENRAHNVKKATALINGTIVKEGEVFSFNGVTGERTANNGYKESPTILNGKYTIGVGGGVCQVSTTLYNAVLLAGLKIERVSPHSLPVGYVPPSMDAMVSSATDFRFFNDTPYPITIKGQTKGSKLTFKIYGFKTITDGESIKYVTTIIRRLPALYEEVLDDGGELAENEEYKIIKKAKDGLISECYKETYFNGALISSVRIRRDVYNPESGIKLVRSKTQEETKQV